MPEAGARNAEAHPHPAASRPPAAARQPYAPPQTSEPQVSLVAQLDLARMHPRLVMVTDPLSPACEQYRTLRTQIFHAAQRRRVQIIVVTSSIAGEGKTSTALNLAWAIAQSKEKRILLVDSDLRRPNVASYLNLRPEVGFNDVLNGECEALRAVVRVADHELYVLPVSRESLNPTELLSSERLDETLEELRDYFDFILIDSPPVAPFADARLLANHADAVTMVVRAGAAPYATVERAIEALPSGRILGVVLNGAEGADEHSYYDYYYNYTKRDRRRPFDWKKWSQRLGLVGRKPPRAPAKKGKKD
jgi:capsular exopolysaccharide synthesis family protein